MKVLHVTRDCPIDSFGGTARYVRDLILESERLAIAGSILWLSPSPRDERTTDEGIQVRALHLPGSRLDDPPRLFRSAVVTLLRELPGEVRIHFHTMGMGELVVAEEARRLGLQTYFTYHSPAFSCRRDDLLIWGRDLLCDGRIRPWRCSACGAQQQLGGPPLLGHLATALSLSLTPLFAVLPPALRAKVAFYWQTRRFGQRFADFLRASRGIIGCCGWSLPVLRLNGAAESRLHHLPQGVSREFLAALQKAGPNEAGENSTDGKEFRIACVSRISPLKGLHLLVEAFTRLPDPDLRLELMGLVERRDASWFRKKIRPHLDNDRRIGIAKPLSFLQMPEYYRSLSLLAIPSVWPETGPLVLLEAIHMETPVMGSGRVGQIDLLRQWGTVVPDNTVAAWVTALEEVIAALRRGEGLPASTGTCPLAMADVAGRMAWIYEHSR
ncbi:MAG: glycosyltransferase [Magnetococcales bacterium]|nr:glycosyltransferase [Magnetococcales bacterium]